MQVSSSAEVSSTEIKETKEDESKIFNNMNVYSTHSLNINSLRDDGKTELLELLESLRGRKCMVLDIQLNGLLNQIIIEGSRLLKENGVQYFRELRGIYLSNDLSIYVSI
jgi:hypothetical protein